jgi:ParB family chromosome partitioning protein
MEHRALGKGLSALISEKSDLSFKTEGSGNNVALLKTDKIRDNSFQPRVNYDEDKLDELIASIKEKGILQPILVRETPDGQGYEVIAGERRLRAARALNLAEIPAVVRQVSNQEALVLALIENIQREELNPIEEGLAFRRLIEEFNLTQDQVAQSVGKERSTITNTLRLLKLPAEIQQSVSVGKLSMGHARALLSLEDFQEQIKFFNIAIQKQLSVREIEELVRAQVRETVTERISKAPTKDRDLTVLEDDLKQIFGTKVEVIAKKKRGKIVIEYYNLDDLDRILKIIKK